MRPLSRNDAADRMNKWSVSGIPFLFLISYDMKECYVEKPENISSSEMLYDFNGLTNIPAAEKMFSGIIHWELQPVPYREYKVSFDKVMKHIRTGNSFLTNLTCTTSVHTNLDLRDLFYHAVAPYKLWIKDRFTVFFPRNICPHTKRMYIFIPHERYDRRFYSGCTLAYYG